MGEELITVRVRQTCTVTTVQPGASPVVGVVQPRTLTFRTVVSETPEYCVFESLFKGLSRYFVLPSRDIEVTKPVATSGSTLSFEPQSTSVKLVRYDAACKVLYVTYTSTPEVEYAYADVPRPLWDRLADCHHDGRGGVGRFIAAHIKGIYAHSQVPA